MPVGNSLLSIRWHLEEVTKESSKVVRTPKDLHGCGRTFTIGK